MTLLTYLGSKECWSSTHKRGSRASRGKRAGTENPLSIYRAEAACRCGLVCESWRTDVAGTFQQHGRKTLVAPTPMTKFTKLR
jgi:hypothetical protein